MSVAKGFVLAFTLACAGVMLKAAAPPDALPSIRLKTISARVDSKTVSLVVEATEPVPYVMTRPDPLTVLLDFRNVSFEGVANRVKATEKGPIARVDVEAAEATAEDTGCDPGRFTGTDRFRSPSTLSSLRRHRQCPCLSQTACRFELFGATVVLRRLAADRRAKGEGIATARSHSENWRPSVGRLGHVETGSDGMITTGA